MILEANNPLGVKVSCSGQTWNRHIITSHPEMYKQEHLVLKIIEDPRYILVDKDYDTRYNYLDLCNFPKGTGYLTIMKVVVDHTNSTGEVITAYPIVSTTQAITKRGVIYERP